MKFKGKSKSTGPKKIQSERIQNMLVMRPVRKVRWKYADEDETKVIIFFPRFESALGKRLGEIYKMKPYRKIHLDEYGTSVWKLCNGKATVRQIGELLSEQYGDKVEPLHERLQIFLNVLERNEMIKFRELKSPVVKRKR
ncbi:MAG: PqqD family protein [Thermoplasmata archaeon]|nr:MAG: PqqD family protein [Thermoplasmata archaeon]